MAAAAHRIRQANPEAVTVLYYTVDNVRVESDIGRQFLAKPELLWKKTDSKGNLAAYYYDWTQPEAVELWANGLAAAVEAGSFDGVFIDGYNGWKDCAPKGLAVAPRSGLKHRPGCPEETAGMVAAGARCERPCQAWPLGR